MPSGTYIRTDQHKKKIGDALRGLKRSEEFCRRSSERQKGKIPACSGWNKGLKFKHPGSFKSGANHPLWKGGISDRNNNIRKTLEYKLWRKAVFERDKYTCVWCKRRGGRLNADHVKPFADYPELRFAIDNGRTLCIECHRKTDTYGWNKYNNKIKP